MFFFDKTWNNLYCLSVFDNYDQEYCTMTTMAGVEMECLGLDRRRAETVQSLQKRIGFPDGNNLAYVIDCNLIGNYQFNRQYIHIANEIHGKNIVELRNKSTRRKVKISGIDVKHDVPKTIMDTYQQIYLDINIMYVNKVAYLTAISEHI